MIRLVVYTGNNESGFTQTKRCVDVEYNQYLVLFDNMVVAVAEKMLYLPEIPVEFSFGEDSFTAVKTYYKGVFVGKYDFRELIGVVEVPR